MHTHKIAELKSKLIEYAALVEQMIAKSIQGLKEKNESLLVEVMFKDEPKSDDFDIEIDEMSAQTIAQFEPVASDLRMVLMVIKMNKDLERMADHIVNVSESGIFLISRPLIRSFDDIAIMAETARSMLKDSIAAFVNGDAVLAKAVCERDTIVDQVADKILQELIQFMHEGHDGIKRAVHIMRMAHNLERIADLTTNICEEVVYIVEGKDIKHHHHNNN